MSLNASRSILIILDRKLLVLFILVDKHSHLVVYMYSILLSTELWAVSTESVEPLIRIYRGGGRQPVILDNALSTSKALVLDAKQLH